MSNDVRELIAKMNAALGRLANCPALSLDELDDEDRQALDDAHGAIGQANELLRVCSPAPVQHRSQGLPTQEDRADDRPLAILETSDSRLTAWVEKPEVGPSTLVVYDDSGDFVFNAPYNDESSSVAFKILRAIETGLRTGRRAGAQQKVREFKALLEI